ncbi:MAG: hypothetical protein AAF335_02510 [Bacteroidota bacterium]
MKNNLRLSITLAITSCLSPIYSASKTVEDYVNEIVTEERLKVQIEHNRYYRIQNKAFKEKFPRLSKYLSTKLMSYDTSSVSLNKVVVELKKKVSQQLKDQETHTFFNNKDKPMLALIEFYARSSTFLTFLRAISGKKEQTMDKFISDYEKKLTEDNFNNTDFLSKRPKLKKVWEGEKFQKDIKKLPEFFDLIKPLWKSSESKTIRALLENEAKLTFKTAKFLVEDLITSENLTTATFLERIAPLKLSDEEEQGLQDKKPFNLDWKTVSLGLVPVVVVIAAIGYWSSKSKSKKGIKEEES